MITYDLEYANEREVKYSYYPWHDTDDKGYIVVSRNAMSDSPVKHGCNPRPTSARGIHRGPAVNAVHRRYKANADRPAVHKDYTSRTGIPG